MPNNPTRIEIITGRERRRRYSAEQKLALVEETMQPGMTVSAVATSLVSGLTGATPYRHYNEVRPHSSLGFWTPAALVAGLPTTAPRDRAVLFSLTVDR